MPFSLLRPIQLSPLKVGKYAYVAIFGSFLVLAYNWWHDLFTLCMLGAYSGFMISVLCLEDEELEGEKMNEI